MASYGWTLNQVLDLTYPQIKAFYRALVKWPTVNIFIAGLSQKFAKESSGDVEQVAGGKEGKVERIGSDTMRKLLASLEE